MTRTLRLFLMGRNRKREFFFMKKRNHILVALLAATSILASGCAGEIEQNPIGLEGEQSQTDEPGEETTEATTEEKEPP